MKVTKNALERAWRVKREREAKAGAVLYEDKRKIKEVLAVAVISKLMPKPKRRWVLGSYRCPDCGGKVEKWWKIERPALKWYVLFRCGCGYKWGRVRQGEWIGGAL